MVTENGTPDNRTPDNRTPESTDLDFETLEELAAYLDGRLDGERKERMEERLARDEELYEVFVESAAFEQRGTLAAEEEGDEPTVVEGFPRLDAVSSPAADELSPGRRWATWAVAAAVALVAVGVSWLLSVQSPLRRSGDLLADLRLEVAAGTDLEARLGAGWYDPAWPARRGTGDVGADGLTAEVRSFRLGAQTAALDAALAAGDREAAYVLASRIAALAEAGELFAAAALFGELADAAEGPEPVAELVERARRGERYLVEVAEVERFRAGRWAETGRLAVGTGELDLLARPEFRRHLERLRSTAPEEERVLLEEVVAELTRQPLDPGRLGGLFTDLLRRGGRRS